MTRCQHWDKLTDSEHVNIYYKFCDHDKIYELSQLSNWIPIFIYCTPDYPMEEIWKLKCGDIFLHFITIPDKIKLISDLDKKNELWKRLNVIDPEFMIRAEEMMKYYHEDSLIIRRARWNKWTKNNYERFKKNQKKYFESEKGKYAISKKSIIRRRNIKSDEKELSWEEKILIGRFYKNCPKGYEVDHIYPISKGGKHRLNNLQYLTKSDNCSKGAKLDWVQENDCN